ncbi:L-serine dehydratase, iron-sulfur-dependent, alpha subunit [Thermosinus carboxydivorans Nor1]|uniref:L-serine dehydratase n=1 Tax=Thermosinus carboxydivorans Nor1 TaxID=401526 RepID=A1HMG1_9FIRM|nr:L-serine ammonia-lyase, iron-sulfur-dependent, subunit alpha [Thermosinus carboxydivorans]EAX49001.1 L-serine dehydratase, iron-sulfur-dependent, alpha subunit [Thermosinus carboxydivorans Nor1]
MVRFSRIAELVALAEQQQKPVGYIVWQYETERSQRPSQEIWNQMHLNLAVMREAVQSGLASREKSLSGLVGGDAARMKDRLQDGSTLCGSAVYKAAAYALAVSEVNAGMGRIVACPTAGSCGIVPGALLAVGEGLGCDDETLVQALFTTAGIGLVIAENASISGAKGGCQAECGTAAAMAAGAIVEMAGGTPRQVGHALALALKNMLGLVCDPVAGLVEVPCVKRNAFGAVHALVAADMALAGIESVIPADEVIDAMHQIGLVMPKMLRETSEGGLARTPTAVAIEKRLFGKND